jgi:hypothetical protein
MHVAASSIGAGVLSPLLKIPGHKADHPTASGSEVLKEWSYTSNYNLNDIPVAYRGGGLGGSTPPKFRNFDKVPKIKKLLLFEMKFLVSNYSFLQNP